MKASGVLALLSAVGLATAARKTSGLCTKSSSVVSAISNPSGSAFCASLLGIPQTVVTSTSTIQPKARTIMKTIRTTDTTATVTKTVTTRSTTVVTNVATTQSTATSHITSAAYLATNVDCVSATDQFEPYTMTLDDSDEFFRQTDDEEKGKGKGHGGQSAELFKRDTAPAALKGQSKRRRNAFCNCLSLQPGTTTLTTTTHVRRTTVTSTMTSTISAKTVTKGTATKTLTKTRFSTSTLDPATTTVTVAVITPTPATYAGVNYYAFNNNYNYNLADPGFDATEWESNAYELSGLIQNIEDEHTDNYPSGANTCSLPDGNVFNNCRQSTFVNQGFLHATMDGTYVVASDNTIDNGMYIWSGENAYSGYDNDNMDYEAVRAGGGPYFGGSQSYDFNAGDLIPFTIMAVNGGGPGRAILSITTPDGETTTSDGHFMPACQNSNPFSP